jgi:hypothetical protein
MAFQTSSLRGGAADEAIQQRRRVVDRWIVSLLAKTFCFNRTKPLERLIG